MKQTLQTPIRAKLRLGEVERLIKTHRIIVPAPTRHTLIKMCEEGIFETVGGRPTRIGWLVFEESFWKWTRELDGQTD